MRKFIFLSLLAFFSVALNVVRAQAPADSLMSFEEADRPPVFPGCESLESAEELRKCFDVQLGILLNRNIYYPSDAREVEAQGTVYLEVVIDREGYVTDIRNTRPDDQIHPSLVKEAVRVVKKLPRMQPAVHEGKPVAVKYAIPLSFKLG